jgi:hypothetical protein
LATFLISHTFIFLFIGAVVMNDLTDYGLFARPLHLVRYQDGERVYWLRS